MTKNKFWRDNLFIPVLSAVESGIRQGLIVPEQKKEGARGILEEFIPNYQKIIDDRFIQLGYLTRGEHLELNPSLEIRSGAKIIHLHFGIHGIDQLSLDLILLWSRILRSSQFLTRYPQTEDSRSVDIPTIHNLFVGRMGIYSGEGSKREEILHDDTNGGDDRWDYTVVSGRDPYIIRTWERSALLLSIVPDSAHVTLDEIKLPL